MIGPTIPLLGIHLTEIKTGYQKDICTPMFIAALFTIAKIWKQPECPSADEWIKKRWYIHSGILFCHEKGGHHMDEPGEHYAK